MFSPNDALIEFKFVPHRSAKAVMFPVLFTLRDSLNGNQEKEYVATAGTRPELTEGAPSC